jgi:murein DD-endopeptidase MepM/ murein hydrolase activator NlpD
MIQVAHGNGIVTVYAHNSQNLVDVGHKVRKGQQIANMGSTGASTGPHVHYEVRVNGTAVNPANFL